MVGRRAVATWLTSTACLRALPEVTQPPFPLLCRPPTFHFNDCPVSLASRGILLLLHAAPVLT